MKYKKKNNDNNNKIKIKSPAREDEPLIHSRRHAKSFYYDALLYDEIGPKLPIMRLDFVFKTPRTDTTRFFLTLNFYLI